MAIPHLSGSDAVGRDDPPSPGPVARDLVRGDAPAPAGAAPASLPLSKLRGLAPPVRSALRRRGVTTCVQLLRAAGRAEDRARLAREAGLPPGPLLELALRADMARVDGVGIVFGMMLEDLGVRDVPALADQEPGSLHALLHAHNREERLARRSPTPGEVADWVGQARGLPRLVTCD